MRLGQISTASLMQQNAQAQAACQAAGNVWFADPSDTTGANVGSCIPASAANQPSFNSSQLFGTTQFCVVDGQIVPVNSDGSCPASPQPVSTPVSAVSTTVATPRPAKPVALPPQVINGPVPDITAAFPPVISQTPPPPCGNAFTAWVDQNGPVAALALLAAFWLCGGLE